ncbi:hypothetical protein VTN02DRAFT_2340 [Thermoascus thermophilus]
MLASRVGRATMFVFPTPYSAGSRRPGFTPTRRRMRFGGMVSRRREGGEGGMVVVEEDDRPFDPVEGLARARERVCLGAFGIRPLMVISIESAVEARLPVDRDRDIVLGLIDRRRRVRDGGSWWEHWRRDA